jgi:hypothetical protein
MMAELEPGHPDELVVRLRNWLKEANDPIGSLPPGTDPVEWACRRFIDTWAAPVRDTIREIEDCLQSVDRAVAAGDLTEARMEADAARQLVNESLRDELGLYPWDEPEPN